MQDSTITTIMSREIECRLCYRNINVLKDDKEYYCKYCNVSLIHVEPQEFTMQFKTENREFRLSSQKNWYMWVNRLNYRLISDQGMPSRKPEINTLFDMWGDLDWMLVTIYPIIEEGGIRFIETNKIIARINIRKCNLLNHIKTKYLLNNISCNVECRTKEREKLLINLSDWENLENLYDINLQDIIQECESIQRFCDKNQLDFHVETKNLVESNQRIYVTQIYVGDPYHQMKSFGHKSKSRNLSIKGAYLKAQKYLQTKYQYNNPASYNMYTVTKPEIDPTPVPEDKETKVDIKPLITEVPQKAKKPVNSPETQSKPIQIETNLKSIQTPTEIQASTAIIQYYSIRGDRWDDMKINNIATITLGELCGLFHDRSGGKSFNARLIIDNDVALSLYRSSSFEGKLSSYLSTSSTLISNPAPKLLPLQIPTGYQLWLVQQTKSVQEGQVMLCEICRDSRGVHFDFLERTCGINYCQTCWDKKNQTIPQSSTTLIKQKSAIITGEEDIIESYITIDLMTNKEKRMGEGYHMSLEGWRGGEEGRDAEPIFAQYHMTLEDNNKYTLNKMVQTIYSAWKIDYGLLDMIIKTHKLKHRLVERDGYWGVTKLERVVYAVHVPIDLSLKDIIERMWFYYFQVKQSHSSLQTEQELVDMIYDNNLLRFEINKKHYGPRPIQSSVFNRVKALHELDERKKYDLVYQVCQVLIKNSTKYDSKLVEQGHILIKKNEADYKRVLPQILQIEYHYSRQNK